MMRNGPRGDLIEGTLQLSKVFEVMFVRLSGAWLSAKIYPNDGKNFPNFKISDYYPSVLESQSTVAIFSELQGCITFVQSPKYTYFVPFVEYWSSGGALRQLMKDMLTDERQACTSAYRDMIQNSFNTTNYIDVIYIDVIFDSSGQNFPRIVRPATF